MGKNWKLRTIIIAVRDMDKAVKHYESIGITGFSPEFLLDRSKVYTDLKLLRPQDLESKVSLRVADLGQVHLELLQPVEGESFQKEFIDKKGEGVVQIVFEVDDIEAETAKMIEKGFPIAVGGHRDVKERRNQDIAIFDTTKTGGVYIELVQHNK